MLQRVLLWVPHGVPNSPRPHCWCLKQLCMGPSGGFGFHEIGLVYFFLCLRRPPASPPAVGPRGQPRSGRASHRASACAPLCFGVPRAAVQGAPGGISGLTGWPEEGVTATLRTDFSL